MAALRNRSRSLKRAIARKEAAIAQQEKLDLGNAILKMPDDLHWVLPRLALAIGQLQDRSSRAPADEALRGCIAVLEECREQITTIRNTVTLYWAQVRQSLATKGAK